ncbi:MAG: molybdenum cofactor carrier protein [Proteobacteria bacterium]|nr:molybdenum cofactor carrier protein [Pseudomonadota bacterium]
MGSAEDRHDALSNEVAAEVARLGYHLLTGAGDGVMAAVAEAFAGYGERQGLSIGVVRAAKIENGEPSPMRPAAKRQWQARKRNRFVEIAINTHLTQSDKSKDSRNHINALTPTAVVILPGGNGTLSELELALEYGTPTVLYIGEKTVGGKDSSRLRSEYKDLCVASNQRELAQFLASHVGDACA